MNSFFDQLENKEKQMLRTWLFRLLFFGAISIFVLPFLFTLPSYFGITDFTNRGPVGDTVNGIAGPFLALAGIIVTFLAFYIQVKANEQQRKDIRVERFENKFYELLRLHKENVNEIAIDGYDQRKIEKRKAFVSMYKELRFAFFITKQSHSFLISTGILKKSYSDSDLLRMSYIFFYAGVGIHSDKTNKSMMKGSFDNELYDRVCLSLSEIQSNHKTQSKSKTLQEIELPDIGKAMLPKSYRPFVGHLNRLGHYYRHLFQTVRFVVEQDESFISHANKLDYLKTLRAQLSDHEQVMLYYNAIVGLGEAWITNGYFTKYKMIHNLPLPLADFGISPDTLFKKELEEGLDMFEWHSVYL